MPYSYAYQTVTLKIMLSYKFYLKPSGELRLRLINDRRKAEISLSLKVTQEQLDDVLNNNKTKPQNAALKRLLANYQAKIENIKIDLCSQGCVHEDVSVIKDIVKCELFGCSQKDKDDSKPKNAISVFIEDYMRRKSKTAQRNTIILYQTVIKHLQTFDADFATRTFEQLDYVYLSNFDEYLTALGVSGNTRCVYFARLRAICNDAFKREVTDALPFRRFNAIKQQPTRKRNIPPSVLYNLYRVNLQGAPSCVRYSRDMFLLSFMLIGINMRDLVALKYENIITDTDGYKRLVYNRAKTGREYNILIPAEALAIIDQYAQTSGEYLLKVSPRTNHNSDLHDKACALHQMMSRGLRTLAKLFPELNLPTDITSYFARHSWATIAASLDIPRDTIAHALGHGNNTVTDIYIDFDLGKVDDANRRVLDYALHGVK